jgi:hypothetical protein
MYKSLLRNEQEYKNLRESLEYENVPTFSGHRERQRYTWYLSDPDFYPCICVYELRNNDNGADYYDGDFIYIMDFEGLAVNPLDAVRDE